MGEVLALTDYYETISCTETGCGISFAMPQSWIRARRNDHAIWCCPNGHERVYKGESEAEQLKRELEEAKRSRDHQANMRKLAENSVGAYRGQATKAKNKLAEVKERVANGLCPCCRRNFKSLAAHMKTKHPNYKSKAE